MFQQETTAHDHEQENAEADSGRKDVGAHADAARDQKSGGGRCLSLHAVLAGFAR
jgi:hypothetical protein